MEISVINSLLFLSCFEIYLSGPLLCPTKSQIISDMMNRFFDGKSANFQTFVAVKEGNEPLSLCTLLITR